MREKYVEIWVLCCLFLLISMGGYGQSRSATLGKQFYVAFGENAIIGNISLKLKVATTQAASVTVTYSDGYTSFTQNVGAYTTTDIPLQPLQTYPSLSTSGGLLTGVFVQSTAEISLYAINQANNSTEATSILPIESLGTHYNILSYKASQSLSVFAVVPTANNTAITVTKGGTTNSSVLNVGEVYYALSPYNGDVTEYTVASDKPVAVFSLPSAVKIPETYGDADNLFEQLWETSSWGKKYLIPATDRGKDRIRVMARDAATQITNIVGSGLTGRVSGNTVIPAVFPISLVAGDWEEFEISGAVELHANKPVAVSSYMSGNKYTATSGDPSQCWINPVEQMTAYSLISPFYMPSGQSMINTHRLVIVTREKYKTNTALKINNNPQTLTFVNPPGISDYAIATVNMYNANNYIYEIENLYGFNAYVYGYGSEESYFLTSGANIWDLNAYFTIDTIHHKATSPLTNTYSTSGTAHIFKNIEYPHDSVKWLIRNDSGMCDISVSVQEIAPFQVEFSWQLPTDTNNAPFCLEMGENEIILIVKNTLTGYYDTMIGKIWITPPPAPNPDFEIIFGNNGNGSGGGSDGSGDTPCIPVLDNDDFVTLQDSVFISETPSHGKITSNTIPPLCYTPDSAFTGIDTITYCIKNEYNDTVCEKVYILTVLPTADHYEACSGTTITIGLQTIPNVTYNWYDAPTAGVLIANSVNTIDVLVTTSKKYYFEAIVGGVPFNAGKRYPIEVSVSELCGETSEMACDGNILFAEDFRGNDSTDMPFGDVPLYPYPQQDIPYGNYFLMQSAALDTGQYALPKTIDTVSDHTFEGNNQRGRMLYIHTRTSAFDTLMGVAVGNICKGLTYSFSAWIINADTANKPNLIFELVNTRSGSVCSRFAVGEISPSANQWRQYGFKYKASSDYQDLKLFIINTTGENTLLIDDIKIAICVPSVSLNLSHDTVCLEEAAQFSAVLDEAGVKDSLQAAQLGYLWQYNNGQDSIWTNIYYSSSKNYTVNKAYLSHRGYYRVVVGNYAALSLNGGIHNLNCVAVSEKVYLLVKECFNAFDDYAITPKDSLLVINILNNDIVPCTNTLVTIFTNPNHGNAFIDTGNHLHYTPDDGFIGIDSLRYRIVCDNETKYAWVYIVTAGFKANRYSGCPDAEIVLEIESIPDVSVKWYRQAVGGSSISTAASYTLIMPNSDTVLYVECTYKGVVLSQRIAVYVVLSELCGSYTEAACEGNAIFWEDFKGNNPTDPNTGNALTLPIYTDYTFSTASYFASGYYSVCKNKANDLSHSWGQITDHTYLNDTSSGYFMYLHTQNSPDIIYQTEIPVHWCNEEEDFYISAWLRNFNTQNTSKPVIRFVVEDSAGEVLLDYITGEIHFDNQWRQYGAAFTLTDKTSRIIIKLYDLSSAASWVALDDIVLQICTPTAINIVSNNYIECEGDTLCLSPNYNTNALEAVYGTGNVVFRWQKSTTGNINDPLSWTTLNGRTSDALCFASLQPSDEGYYRLLAGNTSAIDNPNCRTASKPIRILINALPSPAHSGITAMCVGDATQLTVKGGNTYLWYHNSSQDSVLQYIIQTDDTLRVQMTSSKGCSIDYKIAITAYPAPVVGLPPDTAICIGSLIRLEAQTAEIGLQYLWNTNAMTKTIDVSPSYPQSYTLKATNTMGCKTFDTIYVDVNPLPLVDIVGDTVVCRGETLSLTAHGGTAYRWSDGTTNAFLLKQPLQNTAYSVAVTDNNGCVNSKSVHVIVNQLPNVAITGRTSLCIGDTTLLTASGGVIYQWSNGDIFSSTLIKPAKDDTLHVTVTNAENCHITIEIPITVYPLPKVVISGDTGICKGESFHIHASAPGFILTSYSWNTGSTTSGLTYTPEYSDYYMVTVEDSKGCKNQQQHLVAVYDLPDVWISGTSFICPNEAVRLEADGNAVRYIWDTGEEGKLLIDYPLNNRTYGVRGISIHGCESPVQYHPVAVHPFPKANMELSPLVISRKNAAVSFNTHLQAGEQALWLLGDGSESGLTNFSHTYTITDNVDTFFVTLIVTSQYGCQDTAYQIIRIEQHIPNTFTPNDDGFNDLFLEDCKCSNIQIFDRLGLRIYDGKGPWDGKYKGGYVANDTYFYIITYSNGDIQKGYISVIGSKK